MTKLTERLRKRAKTLEALSDPAALTPAETDSAAWKLDARNFMRYAAKDSTEAADEIERLNRELEAAGETLKPFAEALDDDVGGETDTSSIWESSCAMALEFRHLRAARRLYGKLFGGSKQTKSSDEK